MSSIGVQAGAGQGIAGHARPGIGDQHQIACGMCRPVHVIECPFDPGIGILDEILAGYIRRRQIIDAAEKVTRIAALLQIDQQHPARLEPPFADDVLFRHRQHTAFRSQAHDIVLGDAETRGPQAIAVQRRTNLAAIGEGYRRRSVPWFHECGVVFVEGAAFLVHQRISGPGLGNQHHHGVGHGVSARDQQLQRVVERRRV